MARVATPNLSMGTWLDGDNPGAGSQTVDSTGLNGNFIKLDTAVGVGHTAAGAHKGGVIDGPNLAATAVDASSIQLSGAPLKLSVKALGIVASMLAAGAVIAGKLADGAIEQASRIADGIITGAKLAAGTITSTQLAPNAVVTAGITDGNVTDAKFSFKVFNAIVNQSGTGAPTLTVVSNTLGGSLVPTYFTTGFYKLTLAGAFPNANKVLIYMSQCPYTSPCFIGGVVLDANTIALRCCGLDTNAKDSGIAGATLLIEVYP
jgi:hypothetical protein